MKKTLLLAGTSAVALMFGIGAAMAEQGATAQVNGGENEGVYGNVSEDNGSTRDNNISDVTPEAGISHVQQNNGSNNQMGVASAVQSGINQDGDTVSSAAAINLTGFNSTVQEGGTRTNDVLDSYNDFSGVAAIQQNNGDHNSMGIANAVHGNVGGSQNVSQTALTVGLTGAQTSPQQILAGYEWVWTGFMQGHLEPVYAQVNGPLTDNGSTRTNLIDPSFNGAQGIVSVQQNNGNGNSMGIANSVVVNTGLGNVSQVAATLGAVALQATIDNSLERDNTISDNSFDGSSGIMNAQQNNGDANVMGIANAVSANLEGIEAENDVDQGVVVAGLVAGVSAHDNDGNYPDGDRTNLIDGSFDDAQGIFNVQQNNGSNNVMGIANAVQANFGGEGSSVGAIEEVNQFSLAIGGTVEGSASQEGTPLTPGISGPAHRENDITGSFDNTSGLANVQQNEGDNNVIGSGNAVVVNDGSGDKTDAVSSLSATAGGSYNNSAIEVDSGANRDNTIENSFKNFEGMANVQQNNGNNNTMGIASAVVVNRGNSSDVNANDVSNGALSLGSVQDNYAEDHVNTDRVNTIDDPSFDGATGIMTVQQNNGDNNVIGAATSVAADIDNGTGEGFGPALSTAATGSIVSGNTTIVAPTSGLPGYQNNLTGSFTGASGIMTVQQNNGSNNAINSAVSVAVNVPAN